MTRNEGPLFNRLPSVRYIEEKKKELSLLGSDLWGTTDECVRNQLVRKSAVHCNLTPTDNIVDLALQLEEDVAIIHQGMLAAICFCFPSSWIPSERIGLRLSEIHQPVADSDVLVKMSDRLASTMADQHLGSFKRSVWTITSSDSLSNHPSRKSLTVPNSIKDLFMRVETQTTEPLGDGVTSLFFVKINVFPLTDIWEDHKKEILDSINSMSNNILTYKNLHHIKILLNKHDEGLISHK